MIGARIDQQFGCFDIVEMCRELLHSCWSMRATDHQLAKNMGLRFIPKLSFKLDTTFDDVDHLDDLLRRTAGKSGNKEGPANGNG